MPRDFQLIRFNALRNALYHTARRRTFERQSRIFNFATVALGTAAVADVMPEGWWVYAAGAVAIIGALQLVLDFAGSARTHQSLQRDYYNLLAEIEETDEPDEDRCRQWEGKLIRISAEEPPTLRVLDAKAYNDAIDALEWGNGERLTIRWWQMALGAIFAFEGTNFSKVSELMGPATAPTAPAE